MLDSEFLEILEVLEEFLTTTDGSLTAFLGIISTLTSMSIWGFTIVAAIIAAVVSFLVAVVIYVLEAIPLFVLGRKAGRKYSWIAWIPVFGEYCRMFVLSDIAGGREFSLFNGKVKLKNRFLSFWIYVVIRLFGPALVTTLIAVLNVIPVVGQVLGGVTALLYLVPNVATGFMEYVYLRDVLNLFKEDKKSNITAAIVVTVLDNVITAGFARIVYLYTILKRNPLPEEQPASIVVADASV